MEGKATKRSRNERGMALVMVLGVLAVVLVIVVQIMAACEVIAREAYVAAKRMEHRYIAESGADHAFWMHLTDRRLFVNRKLGEDDEARVSNTDFEPWMADKRGHRLFDANTYAYIDGVEKSIRLDKTESFKANVDAEDTEALDIINDFLDVLGDYTDADSLVKAYGKEEEDYADEGYYAMPRNGEIQFREEVFWLDGWVEALKGAITIIPPSGKKLGNNKNSKPSFFSASDSEIQIALSLTDSELQQVIDARTQWMKDGTPISDTLSGDLILNINNKFSFTEENVAEFIVSSATVNGEVRSVFRETREVNISQATIYADKQSQAFSIWNRLVY